MTTIETHAIIDTISHQVDGTSHTLPVTIRYAKVTDTSSECIRAIYQYEGSNDVFVLFQRGGTYRYHGAGHLFAVWAEQESLGGYFNRHIRNDFGTSSL